MEATLEEVIVWGYEISGCNDEGLTDFDEAVRLAMEQGGMEMPTDEQLDEWRVKFDAEFDR